jgi:hypothetical protein
VQKYKLSINLPNIPTTFLSGLGGLAVVMVVAATIHELLLYLAFDLIEAADLLGGEDCGKLVDILQTDGLSLLLTLHAVLGELQLLLVSQRFALTILATVPLRVSSPQGSHLVVVAAIDGFELSALLVSHL